MAAMVDQPTAATRKSSRASRFCCLIDALFTVYAPRFCWRLSAALAAALLATASAISFILW